MSETSSPADNAISLAEQAYRVLEEKLVTLELLPGFTISEGRLIELTGFGRTPVREAIQKLAHQGLFYVMPRKGLMVTEVSRNAMTHVLEARKPLERVIVYRAALNARDAQRSELASIARLLTISHDSFEDFLKLDGEMDALLDVCAGNPFASLAVAPLRSHCRRFWYYYRQRMQLSDAISAQSNMARLVARRDYNGAQKASDGVIAVIERLVASIDRPG
jgi:DNA-binding GntR family transcriptional regulator